MPHEERSRREQEAPPPIAPIPSIKPPSNLETKVNIAENWKTYKQWWENYAAVVAKLDTQPEEYKVALFLHCIGTDTPKNYNGLLFTTEDDKKNARKIIENFDEYTIGEINETYERHVFNSRNQETDESIDVRVTSLHSLAQTCNFCTCLHDTLIRDRIVLGVRRQQVQKSRINPGEEADPE